MTRLNQILGLEAGARTTAGQAKAKAEADLAGPGLNGLSRTYQPRDDEGAKLPGESQRVQVTAGETLAGLRKVLARWWDLALMREMGNTQARGTITIDGTNLLADAPAGYLLFLQTQLTELRAMIRKLPVLDPVEEWRAPGTDGNSGDTYASVPRQTTRSQRVPKAQVLYEATPEHPAQVRAYEVDEVEGYWTTVKFSGALPAAEVAAMTERVTRLLDAVMLAREEANTMTAEDARAGEMLLGYVLGG